MLIYTSKFRYLAGFCLALLSLATFCRGLPLLIMDFCAAHSTIDNWDVQI
ncbi:MAG: hypothetical protein OFPII_25930 [Osedax symbiont Rs1]|nr:MAG: hypothetical protein OFPII_25930 [Osedax symbiont Rs1]